MAYSRSPPRSPASPDDWESRISKPSSKTYSTTSSNSTGLQSRSQSVASSSASSRAQSSSSTNIAAYESAARTYYVELKKFLVAELSAGYYLGNEEESPFFVSDPFLYIQRRSMAQIHSVSRRDKSYPGSITFSFMNWPWMFMTN